MLSRRRKRRKNRGVLFQSILHQKATQQSSIYELANAGYSHHSFPTLHYPSPPSTTPSLDRNPRNRDDDIHALLLRRLPLVAVRAVLLVVPEGADRAVHAAAAVLLGLRGHADVLDHGAVGDVLVRGLCGLRAGRGGGGGLIDEGFEDGLLGGVSRLQGCWVKYGQTK